MRPLILILAAIALAGCTRYRDGTVRWHTFGGEPGERSAKASATLDQIDGTADAEAQRGATQATYRPVALP